MIAFQTSKQILLNFSHRKALVAYSFPSVIRPLVTFRENYFLRDTPQVILDIMIQVSSFYHVGGPRKRAVRHTDGQTDRQTYFGYYYRDSQQKQKYKRYFGLKFFLICSRWIMLWLLFHYWESSKQSIKLLTLTNKLQHVSNFQIFCRS
jgi:hypothetical protein